jgi:hypothetical protein
MQEHLLPMTVEFFLMQEFRWSISGVYWVIHAEGTGMYVRTANKTLNAI